MDNKELDNVVRCINTFYTKGRREDIHPYLIRYGVRLITLAIKYGLVDTVHYLLAVISYKQTYVAEEDLLDLLDAWIARKEIFRCSFVDGKNIVIRRKDEKNSERVQRIYNRANALECYDVCTILKAKYKLHPPPRRSKNPLPKFLESCKLGDLESVRRAVETEITPTCGLETAIKNDRKEVVEYLIKAGARINSCIWSATLDCDKQLLTKLFDLGGDKICALRCACEERIPEMIDFLNSFVDLRKGLKFTSRGPIKDRIMFHINNEKRQNHNHLISEIRNVVTPDMTSTVAEIIASYVCVPEPTDFEIGEYDAIHQEDCLVSNEDYNKGAKDTRRLCNRNYKYVS